MNALWRRRLHGCARASGWAVGAVVILLAVLMALAQLLLPLLARHPAWVAAQLSQRLHRPVSIGSMQGRSTPSGPMFVMHGVTIGAVAGQGQGGAVLKVPESDLRLDFGGLLLPSRHLINLHLRGLQLNLLHDVAGWHVEGAGMGGGASRQPLSLGPVSLGLWLEDLRVDVTDATLGKHYTLLSPQLQLSHQGDRIRFGGILHRKGVTAAVRAIGRFREDGSAGQAWVSVDAAELPSLLDGVDMDGYTVGHGHGQLSGWFDWSEGKLSHSLVRFDLDTLAVSAADGHTANVAALHGLLGLRQSRDGYELRWAGDDHGALVLALHDPGTAQLRVNVAASKLQLAPLLPWLALKPGLSPTLAQWLGSGHPHGELDRLALHWSRSAGLQAVAATFADLGIDPVGKLPGMNSLQGELRGDAEALSLELPVQPTTLQFPKVFRQPFALSKLDGTLAFWPQGGDWHIGVAALDFTGAGYAGQARGDVTLPAQGGAPFMNVYASVDHADVTAAKLFWPVNAMSAATVGWLDRALVSGQVEQAQVLVRGDLADWPFRHNEGRFEARAVIDDLTLDYGGQWPRAEGVDAVASFIDTGMLVEASHGQSLGVKVGHVVALIPDFGEGLLDLNVQGSGSAASLLTYARKSPIASAQADTLAKLNLGGNGTFQFHLSLPLKKLDALQLHGTAQLSKASLSAPDWNLQLDQLDGPLSFDAHGLQVGPLDATVHGEPSTLQMSIAGANSDPDTVLSAQLQGSYQVAELVQDYPSLQWLGQLSSGRSDFSIGFKLAHVTGSDALAQTLSIDSPLNGIALDLPDPLHKPATGTLPLHLSMSLPVAGSDLQVALGDAMRGHLRLANGTQPLAATLAFGKQVPQSLPSRDLRIRGHAHRLDVTGWVQRAVAGSGGDGPGLESIEVSADQAEFFGRPLGSMRIHVTPKPDGLSADVDGAALAGNFSVPNQQLGKRGITARLQRLYWPGDEPKPVAPANAATAVAAASNPANTGIAPAALPPLHLLVRDLRLGDAKLGQARLETWPTARGMHIEQLRALSSSVQINASGDWNGSATDSHTHMRVSFAADDLGKMLTAFGYTGLVSGGKTQDQLDASWPGAPSAFDLANMDGTLNVQVSDGRIPEVGPGMGRLFGLVSLAELPRRLTLDFGDVFAKGLGFDSINGDFQLADGNAFTHNLVIKGPAVQISINGRTGLRAKDYDQIVTEVPHVGNSLPVIGAVVGGPIGAAAGLAVQGILGKGLNKTAGATYHVTGSWDKPVMTLIEKHGVPPPPAAPLLDPADSQLPAAAGSVMAPTEPAVPATSAPAGSIKQH